MVIFLIFAAVAAFVAICAKSVNSKSRFDNRIQEITKDLRYPNKIDATVLDEEFDRVEQLQENLVSIKQNIENLEIPTPESVSSYDDSKSTLNKLSAFFERHNSATVGTEQFILSVLPTSQIGQSLHSVIETIPSNLGNEIFGNAIETIGRDMSSVATMEGLERFTHGLTHLSPLQMASMSDSIHQHNICSAILTPIKSGAFEAVGVNDAAKDIAHSISSIGSDMNASLEASTSIGDLTDVTDIDITGHIPVITVALSSFREIQLLSDDKTDYLTSIKNISLDVAGTGIGALAGAKGGAVTGTMIGGPLGGAIGAFIGAIAGGIGGRMASNALKQKPLKDAIEDYEAAYHNMKSDTDAKSKQTLTQIQEYAETKRDEFHDSELLTNIPVADTTSIVDKLSMVLYQFVLNELVLMKQNVSGLRESFWYSENDHESIIREYEKQITDIESQLPSKEKIEEDPKVIFTVLTTIKMPNRNCTSELNIKINECKEELKTINDKNDSSLLLWSYMVNNAYQQTLNDVADYSNQRMSSLNSLFSDWGSKMNSLKDKVEKEKGKLGIS